MGEQLQNLHDEYFSEIQALNHQLAIKSQETALLFQTLDAEKKQLVKKISDLEAEGVKLKEAKDRLKVDNVKKSEDMKLKLEKAFSQLTANDEAANELQSLRAVIKQMQVKLERDSN